MSLFHHHDHEDAERAADATSFAVLVADGKIRRYGRDAFDMIVETKDPEEVQREVDRGWVILDERDLQSGGRGPSVDDLIVGIEGMRAGGVTRVSTRDDQAPVRRLPARRLRTLRREEAPPNARAMGIG